MDYKINYKSKLLIFFPKWVDAFVFNKTIYVRESTISNRLLKHELQHVKQYKEQGIFKFLIKYFYYNIRYGYKNNPFEIEAKLAEVKY